MSSPCGDERRFQMGTQRNVDGIVSAAFFYARLPDIRVSFVTSSSGALDALRRDIQSKEFFIVDLGATEELVHTIQQKARQGVAVHFLDHHQQTADRFEPPIPDFEGLSRQGVSAAALAYQYLGLDGDHEHLVAVADLVEYCPSDLLSRCSSRFGADRLEEEARILDFAWRLAVDDDRFRMTAARKLAEGRWPSEVPEIYRRYLQVVNEGRWERALDKVRTRMRVKNGVGVLRFGRYRTSLYGFGTRALSHVAEEVGCRVALMLNSRKNLTSLSLRGVGETYAPGLRPPFNLGRFAEDFTAQYGVQGGGHPSSAGAKIYTRDVPAFLQQVYALA